MKGAVNSRPLPPSAYTVEVQEKENDNKIKESLEIIEDNLPTHRGELKTTREERTTGAVTPTTTDKRLTRQECQSTGQIPGLCVWSDNFV